jgi:hypothetical protein
MNMFRTLRADEIDCRIAQIKETHNGKGLSLLLYKDARCDQNILDEVVGPFNWKREHTRENRNCIVSIKNPDNGEWVSKEDTGTESNTEREKGLASDSFKRACFNWGIGRELYTAPFIWISEKDCNIKENRGKLVCYDRFTVKGIGYTDGVITGLEIKNQATGKVCYKWGTVKEEAPEKPEQPDDEPPEVKPIIPAGTATVETSAKLPEAAKISPVVNYIRCEISDIQERTGTATYNEMKKRVIEISKTLQETGALKPFDWKTIKMEEAKDVFKAIREIIFPGDAA